MCDRRDDSNDFIPNPPEFTDEVVLQCHDSGDFRPMLFEWYKYVGVLCNKMACISAESSALKKLPTVHYAILVGMLNRCSRLMVANVRLSCDHYYGETTRLLDRCIVETTIKLLWLCSQDDPECFQRYLADGLRNDLELKRRIESNITKRGGEVLVIERRMLRSIQKCIDLSGIRELDVESVKRLQDLATMCRDLKIDDLFYHAFQRGGSHAVHGTWSDLVLNYLMYDDNNGFQPKDMVVETQDVQFLVVARQVLAAMVSFATYVIADASVVEPFLTVFKGVDTKLHEIQNAAWNEDIQPEV